MPVHTQHMHIHCAQRDGLWVYIYIFIKCLESLLCFGLLVVLLHSWSQGNMRPFEGT